MLLMKRLKHRQIIYLLMCVVNYALQNKFILLMFDKFVIFEIIIALTNAYQNYNKNYKLKLKVK